MFCSQHTDPALDRGQTLRVRDPKHFFEAFALSHVLDLCTLFGLKCLLLHADVSGQILLRAFLSRLWLERLLSAVFLHVVPLVLLEHPIEAIRPAGVFFVCPQSVRNLRVQVDGQQFCFCNSFDLIQPHLVHRDGRQKRILAALLALLLFHRHGVTKKNCKKFKISSISSY